MAKNSITDYDNISGNNTDVQSVDISEGCSPSGINNAIREVMADLADVNDGTVALTSPQAGSLTVTGDLTVDTSTLHVDSTNNRVGIGTSSPQATAEISGGLNNRLRINSTDGTTSNNYGIDFSTAGTVRGGIRYNAGNNYLAFYGFNNAERMRITSGGSVGISNTSPSSYYSQADDLVVGQTGDTGMTIASGTASQGSIMFSDGTSGSDLFRGQIRYNHVSNYMMFATDAAENMRIDSSGTVLFGATSTTAPSLSYRPDSSGGYIEKNSNSTGATTAYDFKINGTRVGSITTSGSSTSYNTSSDYRLKENVTDITGATDRLKQLNPVRFNFIADADTAVDGFLAHEVQDVVPEAITGTKDGMRDEEYEVTPAVLDEDGNEVTPAVMGTRSVPDYQGIDQSKLVPLLVATIQELEARIAALENA